MRVCQRSPRFIGTVRNEPEACVEQGRGGFVVDGVDVLAGSD
jgi:hypothetical protein